MSVSPLDLAQRLLAEQRAVVGVPKSSELSAGMLLPLRGSADAKVEQLAERTSAMFAGLRKESSSEHQEMQKQIEQVRHHVGQQLASLDFRIQACEQQHRATCEALESKAGAMQRKVIAEVQSQCRAQMLELRSDHNERARLFEDLSEDVRQQAKQLQQVEQSIAKQTQKHHHSEEELHSLVKDMIGCETPPWFGQLEGAVAGLDRRLNDQRAVAETSLEHLKVNLDSNARRLDGFKEALLEELLNVVEHRVDKKLEELPDKKSVEPSVESILVPSSGEDPTRQKEINRRLDEAEARIAAVRLRVDAHECRFSSVADRAEAACQSALDGARQAVADQYDECISEMDCQLRIIRQRVEGLSELCEELSFRESTYRH